MAGNIINQIINGTGFNSSGNNDKYKKRARQKRMSMRRGQAGLIEKLNPFKADQWTLERNNRREKVKERYFKEKKQLKKKQRQDRDKMKAQLERQKKHIRSHYRINKLGKNDPRLEKAQKKAQKKIAETERQIKRQHHRRWTDTFSDLKSKRKQQYRDITKSMKKEYSDDRRPEHNTAPPWQP